MVINMAHSLWFDFSLFFYLFLLSVPVFLFLLGILLTRITTKTYPAPIDQGNLINK